MDVGQVGFHKQKEVSQTCDVTWPANTAARHGAICLMFAVIMVDTFNGNNYQFIMITMYHFYCVKK